MPVPTYLVYLSFSSSGYIDVTSYATNVTIDRGSPRILDDTQVGQATVSFINNDRTFDPFNTSSILWNTMGGYTLVQPNAKVQIQSGGVVIFTGWVQNWDFTNDEKGLDARASLMATDGLGVLARSNFNPTLITAANTAGQLPTPRISSATAIWGSTAITVSMAGSAGKTPLVGDELSQSQTVLSYLQNVARTEPANFWGTKDGNAKWADRSYTNTTWNPSASLSYNYHLTAGFYNGTATDLSNWILSTEGTPVVTTNSQFPGEYVLESVLLGSEQGLQYQEYDPVKYKPNTAYSVAFWTNAVDVSAEIRLIYKNPATGAYVTKATVAYANTFSNSLWKRIVIENVTTSLICNYFEFYVSDLNGTFQIKDLIISPTSSASSFYFDGERYQETTSTYLNDQQRPYTGWVGTERFSDSVHAVTVKAGTAAATAIVNFADNYGQSVFLGTGLQIYDLQVQYASDQFYNQVNVVRASGGTATTQSTASQALYGIRTFAETDNLGISPARSSAMVKEIYGQFGSPDYVLTSLDLKLEAMAGTAQARVQAIDLYDPARVVFRPSSTGSNIDKKYTIISIKQDFTPETHKVSLGLAPFGAGMLLNSTYMGILDTQKVV
jgi:hypothetical protein